jgi:hypothetical protein
MATISSINEALSSSAGSVSDFWKAWWRWWLACQNPRQVRRKQLMVSESRRFWCGGNAGKRRGSRRDGYEWNLSMPHACPLQAILPCWGSSFLVRGLESGCGRRHWARNSILWSEWRKRVYLPFRWVLSAMWLCKSVHFYSRCPSPVLNILLEIS